MAFGKYIEKVRKNSENYVVYRAYVTGHGQNYCGLCHKESEK